MKRFMAVLVCVAALAVVGCKKDKEGEGEGAAKTGEATDTAATEGDTAAAEADKPEGGDTAAATAVNAEMTTEEMCKLIGEMAEKEGGEALEQYNARLKDDCVADLGQEREKAGEEGWNKFVECMKSKDSLSAAMEECEP